MSHRAEVSIELRLLGAIKAPVSERRGSPAPCGRTAGVNPAAREPGLFLRLRCKARMSVYFFFFFGIGGFSMPMFTRVS
jgi:hypothetical protein